ncbi:hypothetical protein EV702DRAFT_1205195 [Suillus placidus]|uniref:Uncharacterized protein n=1 Tax=Suillus placidus TaxID=48579 RepID=A0A9P7CVI7_9AGAM|nr:hypothetical protein EV702DRAFT_1205195 [Suillus placidus]
MLHAGDTGMEPAPTCPVPLARMLSGSKHLKTSLGGLDSSLFTMDQESSNHKKKASRAASGGSGSNLLAHYIEELSRAPGALKLSERALFETTAHRKLSNLRAILATLLLLMLGIISAWQGMLEVLKNNQLMERDIHLSTIDAHRILVNTNSR